MIARSNVERSSVPTRVLITGVTGFVGSHLAEYILANHPKVELYDMCRWRSQIDNLADLTPRAK